MRLSPSTLLNRAPGSDKRRDLLPRTTCWTGEGPVRTDGTFTIFIEVADGIITESHSGITLSLPDVCGFLTTTLSFRPQCPTPWTGAPCSPTPAYMG